ncbi:hypothetical protein C5E45_06025 [Nocardia nova]|uniref:Uncharacterized protein n=1 Tax=Nocardia nova TaxID=37330 RepID=A0A2S6AV29_9NOCA|nr:hypothetical protein [Nocardia nova]PPJ32440.1 hypothetical protein C5E41_04700 [Nocardia nova]PPJ39049.1 hypothetical protein C5E45_06025 [Nocardia nova]
MAQSAQSRSTGQILQHTAVVLAGMASIGLTVAAGTYVVNQIGGGGLPAAIGSGERGDTIVPAPDTHRSDTSSTTAPAGTGLWGVAAASRRLPAFAATPARLVPEPADRSPNTETPSATTGPGGVGGRLNLTGETYVGANLSRTQQHSFAVTVDTNVPSVLGANGSPDHQPGAAPNTVTEFRTDVDVHSGEFSVAMSDPLLGRHDVQVQRHARPAPVPSHHPQQIPTDQAGNPPGTDSPEQAVGQATTAAAASTTAAAGLTTAAPDSTSA